MDAPLKTGGQAPGDVAVVVGIEDYAFIADVPFAHRDAQAFHDLLVYTRGVPSSRVRLLDDQPNREEVLAAVDDAVELASADATVWLYFAGHGAASPSTGGRMLLGVDAKADLASFEARGIGVEELKTRAAASGARVVLVLDTCYTGQGRAGEELVAGKRFAVPSYATARAPRVLEWSAADANQASGPLAAARHGAFTYTVIGALRGWADGQIDDRPDGTVTAEEADLYVREALRTVGVHDQKPVMTVSDPSGWSLMTSDRLEPRPSLAAEAARIQVQPAPRPATPVSDGTYPMVRIEAGRFTMGCTREPCRKNELPAHEVEITRPYWIGVTEVTLGLWRKVTGANPTVKFPYEVAPATPDRPDELPAGGMAWHDVALFANAMSEREGLEACYLVDGKRVSWPRGLDCTGYRLPTEAEWEYAARAGGDHRYAGGDDGAAVAWLLGRDDDLPRAVAGKAPNAWGLYDMSGNMGEMVWDRSGTYPAGPQVDPLGPSDGDRRVYRGCSLQWSVTACTVYDRRFWSPDGRFQPSTDVGLRLVRTAG